MPPAPSATSRPRRPGWRLPAAVALAVAGVQFWLVARAGTDVPFYDQWGVEGRWLYPAWLDGSLRFTDLLRAHNEHRILWTHLLNLALFAANGAWDPLVQLAAIVALRAACAGGLAAALVRGWGRGARGLVAAGVFVAFLPHLAWHGVLWGFESQVYFALGFSLLALAGLGGGRVTPGRWLVGVAAGVAAQLGMGVGAMVPVALAGLVALEIVERRPDAGRRWRAAAALGLLGLAWVVHGGAPGHTDLAAGTVRQLGGALGRCLAWPYPGNPWVALAANVPLAWLVLARLRRRREPRSGEYFVVAAGLFAVGVAGGAAVLRGGDPELAVGVPSRYADLLVLLPLANAWCAAALLAAAPARWRHLAWAAAGAWAIALAFGWTALSAEMWRGVLRPRLADRDAPVRLLRAFAATSDAAVFAGQPRLYVPSPDLAPVREVLADPRLRGRLPPSLQPGQPLGPLSALVRRLRAHADALLGFSLAVAAGLATLASRRRRFTPDASSGGT